MPSQVYEDLERRFARLSGVDNALGILYWDQETNMPEGSTEIRGEALATLQVLHHELLTDPAMGDRLGEAEGAGGLDDWQQANLREMRRKYLHATAVPSELVEASTKAVTACEVAWRSARRDNDFAGLKPLLQEVLTLTLRIGEAKASALGLDVYDALLDEFEPGLRAKEIDRVFTDLAAFLPDFTGRVLDYQAAQPAPEPLTGPFPVEAQRQLGVALMRAAGFDFTRGRLDVSMHPFCGGADNDTRITTRYDEADFTKALMGVMHETGHALYEQGRPAAWLAQPVGSSRGMAVHESQSLSVEMQACRSREFLQYAAPLMREAFSANVDTAGPAWSVDNLYRLYTKVERGLIRVDADEVTYPAHVILRYRLERAMLAGDLALGDLPGAWADGMAELVGIVPPDDRDGCLQDIHWPGGAWAYFPTYTLGAMIAAQLFDAAGRDEPDLLPALSRGDFSPFIGWMRRNVHAQGSSKASTDLLTAATGRPLDPEVFKEHLARRYLAN